MVQEDASRHRRSFSVPKTILIRIRIDNTIHFVNGMDTKKMYTFVYEKNTIISPDTQHTTTDRHDDRAATANLGMLQRDNGQQTERNTFTFLII